MTSAQQADEIAARHGLAIVRIGRGSATKYKIVERDQTWDETDGLFISSRSSEALAFLRGYEFAVREAAVLSAVSARRA